MPNPRFLSRLPDLQLGATTDLCMNRLARLLLRWQHIAPGRAIGLHHHPHAILMQQLAGGHLNVVVTDGPIDTLQFVLELWEDELAILRPSIGRRPIASGREHIVVPACASSIQRQVAQRRGLPVRYTGLARDQALATAVAERAMIVGSHSWATEASRNHSGLSVEIVPDSRHPIRAGAMAALDIDWLRDAELSARH